MRTPLHFWFLGFFLSFYFLRNFYAKLHKKVEMHEICTIEKKKNAQNCLKYAKAALLTHHFYFVIHHYDEHEQCSLNTLYFHIQTVPGTNTSRKSSLQLLTLNIYLKNFNLARPYQQQQRIFCYSTNAQRRTIGTFFSKNKILSNQLKIICFFVSNHVLVQRRFFSICFRFGACKDFF